MGIYCRIELLSALDESERMEFDAIVDTSATWLTLPVAWRDKFPSLKPGREANFWRPEDKITVGEVCGPFDIRIEGFRPSFGEVMFAELEPINGKLTPLVGSLQLESSQALLDRVNRKLYPLERYILK